MIPRLIAVGVVTVLLGYACLVATGCSVHILRLKMAKMGRER